MQHQIQFNPAEWHVAEKTNLRIWTTCCEIEGFQKVGRFSAVAEMKEWKHETCMLPKIYVA